MNQKQTVVQPFELDRGACEPQINPETFVLKNVDRRESVYSRVLGLLEGAGIPNGHSVEPGIEYPWDLYVMLHYRQDWQPSAYGLGELLHTMSLLPNEEVTMEFKTWETDKRLEEKDTTIEEKNLSDNKNTCSTSSEVTDSMQTKERTYVDAKASYSGFGFSASVSAGWSRDVATAHGEIAKQSRTSTAQATNETKAKRKVKMSLSRETGSESKTTRKFRNINQAYTLNANFYEILREYEVALNLTDVTLVLLGKEVDLNNPAWLLDKSTGAANGEYTLSGWRTEGSKLELDPKITITWGNLLNGIRSNEWTAAFTDVYGFSPTLVLFRQWSKNLYDGGLKKGSGAPLVPDLLTFQQKMLGFVRPSPGWVETDESGRIRWAFEIIPDLNVNALKYLYKFVPFQFSQIIGILLDAGEDQSDANDKALKFYNGHTINELQIMPETIMVSGPFQGVDINTFETESLPTWIDDIISQFEKTKEMIGPVEVDGETFQKVTLPSSGVHADLSLGLCSGAEDYYEIQRQFDLELKKLEVEKLKLEVEKLKILNKSLEKDKPDVLIKSPTETTSVNLNISTSDTPLEVDIENEKE